MANSRFSFKIGPQLSPYDSCWKRINNHVRAGGEEVAFVSMHQQPGLYSRASVLPDDKPAHYLRWTLKDIKKLGDNLAANLVDLGLREGAPVFTFMQNSLEFLLVYWATAALGCTLVPLNPRNLDNIFEVEYMISIVLEKCQSRPHIVFTDNASLAEKLDKLQGMAGAVKVAIDHSPLNDWKPFTEFTSDIAIEKAKDMLNEGTESSENDDNFILFTSGTTSRPKACHWHYPNFASAHVAFRDASPEHYRLGFGDVMAVVGPNNHALALLFMLEALCSGNTVVLPSASFDTEAFCKAVELEGVTHCTVAPVMAKSLASFVGGKPLAQNKLKVIRMGGGDVSYGVMRQCVDVIGAKHVEVLYGSTEGVVIDTGARLPIDLMSGNDVCGGEVLPGCQVKICDQDGKVALPIGHKGELHFAGPSLVDGYLDREDVNFYTEDGLLWQITGDQALMDESGRIFIVGRYKDMIIRGAENIAPAAMEACIARTLPHLAHLQIQIVGAADEYAGEVPVAITAEPASDSVKEEIKASIAQNLGKMYMLDDVLSLEDLGLSDWPRTSIGKIQKVKLKDHLRAHREKDALPERARSSLLASVKEIWGRTVGLSVAQLSAETQLADLADSITIMRVKDRLQKQLGFDVSAEQMATAGSIGGLVDILSKVQGSNLGQGQARRDDSVREAPPEPEDMVHCTADDVSVFESTKTLVSNSFAESGLVWDDVREVFPAYDFTQIAAQNGTFDRWSFKIAIIARKFSVAQLRAAFVAALSNNPMQSSFLIWDKTAPNGADMALHAIVAQKTDFLERLVVERGTLKTLKDLKALALNDANHPSWPGPLVRASLYYIQETRCAGMIWNMHHAIADAFFMQLTTDDLDTALGNIELKPHVPYKLYCDNLFALRESPMAKAAVKYHVNKLKDLSHHKDHIWPPQGLPLQIEDSKPDGYVHYFSAAKIQALCKKHPTLTPSLIIKAANALFLMKTIKHTHAIFSHVEAARDQTFPFLPKSLVSTMPFLNASDIGGQLFQSVLNIISLQSSETVLTFLHRLQSEQTIQQRYAAAPWKSIISSLDPISAELFPKVAVHCMFNWHGSSYKDANAFENIEIVDAVIRKDVAPFVNNCALERGKHGEDRIMLHLRGSVFGVEELREFAGEIERAARWVAEEGNWGKGVGEFLAG